MEAMVALSVVKTAGVLLLAAGSLLVLHILKLADAAEEAPPQPAVAVTVTVEDELRRAA